MPPRNRPERVVPRLVAVGGRLGARLDSFATCIGYGDIASRLAADGRGRLFVEMGDGANPSVGGKLVVVEIELAGISPLFSAIAAVLTKTGKGMPWQIIYLHTHRGDRRVEIRWKRGTAQYCAKPKKKDAPVDDMGVPVVESRFDGKSIWLYAACPDEMFETEEGALRVAVCAAQAYCDRWQIETSFQTVKQEFALEKARVLTFRRREAQVEAVAKPALKAIGA